VLLAGITLGIDANAVEKSIPPAFGPHVNLTADHFAGSKSFVARDRIVGTYFFYWYDIYTKSHILNHDGTDALTTHPPTLEDFSYKSANWYRTQLLDMEAAGIDVALMVFWGAPSEQDPGAALHWSYAGLPPLVQAREELLREGKSPPFIGLFYDTSTLKHNEWYYHADLTTDYGREWFYATVRDFYSCIPPKHWAMIDGKPIVLLYASAFAKKWDQSFIDYAKSKFAEDFGERAPWIAPQDSWGVQGDNTCAWGGALSPRNPGIGEIGPGYDHSAVPGRKPLVREREGGKFYQESWLTFLRRPSNFVMIETWNEFHEGTDIAESKEYGRQYIELTRKYSDLFKSGWKAPWPEGSFNGAEAVFIAADEADATTGLRVVIAEDGQTTTRVFDGRTCWRPQHFRDNRTAYLYFAIDDSYKDEGLMNAVVEIEYFDAAPGRLNVEFDGSDTSAPFNGAYSPGRSIELKGDRRWKTAEFELSRARFRNSQNAGADFRIMAQTPEFGLARATLRRR
jgi:hypothetical protein